MWTLVKSAVERQKSHKTGSSLFFFFLIFIYFWLCRVFLVAQVFLELWQEGATL